MLNGSKVFITNGWMADVVIVVAITDKTAKSNAHGISLFLVDGDTPGFVKGKKLKKMGLKAQVRYVFCCFCIYVVINCIRDSLMGCYHP